MHGVDRAFLILWEDTESMARERFGEPLRASPLRRWFSERFAAVDGINVDNFELDGCAEVYLLQRRPAHP